MRKFNIHCIESWLSRIINRSIIRLTFCKISDESALLIFAIFSSLLWWISLWLLSKLLMLLMLLLLLLLLLLLTWLLLLIELYRLFVWSYCFHVCCIIIIRLILIIVDKMNEYRFELNHSFFFTLNTVNAYINRLSYSWFVICWFNNEIQNVKHDLSMSFSERSLSFSRVLLTSSSNALFVKLLIVSRSFSTILRTAILTALMKFRHACFWRLLNRYLNIFRASLDLRLFLNSLNRVKIINIVCHART